MPRTVFPLSIACRVSFRFMLEEFMRRNGVSQYCGRFRPVCQASRLGEAQPCGFGGSSWLQTRPACKAYTRDAYVPLLCRGISWAYAGHTTRPQTGPHLQKAIPERCEGASIEDYPFNQRLFWTALPLSQRSQGDFGQAHSFCSFGTPYPGPIWFDPFQTQEATGAV